MKWDGSYRIEQEFGAGAAHEPTNSKTPTLWIKPWEESLIKS